MQAFAKSGLELVGLVAHDRDPIRLEAAVRQLRRKERAVRVAPPAPHELTAGDDDRCAWGQAIAGASETRVGVTSSHRRDPRPRPGTTQSFPFSRSLRFAGAKT